jgi:hypothetical protein
MIGLLLVSIGTFFEEISASIGKKLVLNKKETIYSMGFLYTFLSLILLTITSIFITKNFSFSLASLPTFSLRIILEILQAHFTMLSIIKADRTTFNYIRILTIPLLIIVDVLLGYKLSIAQIAGLAIITICMFTIFKSSKINKKGVLFVLFTAINAVITISLYKYNISNFNSVEAEQILINLIIMLYFYINARIVTKEHPFLLLKKTIYLLQSSTQGIAGVVESFAYLFAAPSIILTAKKSTSLIWSIFSGNIYFKEKHIAIKIIVLIFITFGLVLFVL